MSTSIVLLSMPAALAAPSVQVLNANIAELEVLAAQDSWRRSL
jgi:hypothetical protein